MLRKITKCAALIIFASGFGAQVHAQSVVVVPPSGGDDTVALQSAFDAAVLAGPGSTIQLEKGTYCVTSPIVVRGFDGHWQGVGRSETLVKTCADTFPVPAHIVADPAYPADPLLQIISPFVFLEVEGKPSTDVSISDMTIHLEGETNPWLAHGRPEPLTIFRPAILMKGKRPTVVDGLISSVSLTVDNIELRANAEGLVFNLPSWSNIDNGFEITGGVVGNIFLATDFEPINANVSVTRSHFEKVAFSVVQTPLCTDCDITMGGSRKLGNTSNLLYGALLFGSSIGEGSMVDVSHNQLEAQFGAIRWITLPDFVVSMPLPPATTPSLVDVSNNNLEIFAHWFNPSYGMILEDIAIRFGTKSLQASITKNDLRQIDIGHGTSTLSGIVFFAGEDAVISNNKIAGEFIFGGIVAGWFGPPGALARNILIQANELTGTSAGMAPIWLGPTSIESTVIGGPNNTQALDEGTNNSVTGVSNMNGKPPGPRIQEARDKLNEIRALYSGM